MIIEKKLAFASKRLLPSVFESRRLVILEARRKITLGYKSLGMRRFEDAEIARLAESLEQLPQARVATVVATYRRPELLSRAVRSALAQSIRDHVVIVIDDAGGLTELPDDARLFSFSLSSNTATPGVVRNVGMRLSKSKYVAFLDDDNEWEDNHLEVALAALESPSFERRPDIVYTAVQRLLSGGAPLDVLSTSFDRRLLGRTNYVDTNSLVIRRFDGLHFSRVYRARGQPPPEDWGLVFRLSRRRQVTHVPVKTVRYLVNPASYRTAWERNELQLPAAESPEASRH